MRIIIEDDKPVARPETKEEIIQEVISALADCRNILDRQHKRIEEVEVNLKKMFERINSEERPQNQWNSIEKIEAYLKELDQRLRKFKGQSIDETPDLHSNL